MRLKLVKIVYGYDIERDSIISRQKFVPAHEDEEADREVGDEMIQEMTTISLYTRQEWEDLLYRLKSQGRAVEILKAEEELMRR